MKQKFISLLLVFVLITSFVPTFAVEAQSGVSITFSAQKDGDYSLAKRTSLTVTDGLAEEYGYEGLPSVDHTGQAIEGPTVFDAMVLMHKVKYGDRYTKETAKTYLDIGGYGMLTKAFEQDAGKTGFLVNGDFLNDGIVGQYGTTGYSIYEARLTQNDVVEFFFYQDEYYGDYYTFFDKSEVSAEVGSEIQLSLKGFGILSAMGYTPVPGPISGEDGIITVNTLKEDGSLNEALKNEKGEPIQVGTDGSVKLKFDSPGTYIVTANGFDANSAAPIFAPWCKVTVADKDKADKPAFESFEFSTTQFVSGSWTKGETFSPSVLEYNLTMKYNASSIMIMSTTKYDGEKYTAFAEYKNADGEDVSVEIKSEKSATLSDIPFERSVLKVVICDKENSELKTTYVFNITRQRDENKKISKITVVPDGRDLKATKYAGYAEGTLFKADKDGVVTSGTGVSSSHNYYRTYLQDLSKLKLLLGTSTKYAHVRYKVGDGVWTELTDEILKTDVINIPSESKEICITIEVIDDKTYSENAKNEVDKFSGDTAKYYVWVQNVETDTSIALENMQVSFGESYPELKSSNHSYTVIVPNTTETMPVLTFEAGENAEVTLGKNKIESVNGVYSIQLKSSNQTFTVASKDGKYLNSYSIKASKRSKYAVPDKVVDYLCMGSQYINAATGGFPEGTLAGNAKSLGNFGGYITYYYKTPIVNDPNNLYGIDFYAYGNSFADGGSAAENGQVYVSEDGSKWYALAGSEHYEKTAHWDYTITYTRSADDKAYWSDNFDNEISYTAQGWPKKEFYYMNDVADRDTYTYTGIVFDSIQGSVTGDSSVNSYACPAKFGYVDYYKNGTIGADVNPYVENPSASNGFDLEWAVDEDGNLVDVDNKEFHYIKIATASNIWAGGYKEKSTEVSYVVRTAPQEDAVGQTAAPVSINITDGVSAKKVVLSDDTTYDVNLGDMKYVSVGVEGEAEGSNVYINNQRVASGEMAEGFKVTKENGTTLVRVIVQNGNAEPCIYLLKLVGEASESDELIEGIKASVGGNIKSLETTDGVNYSLTVGNRISAIALTPIVKDGVSVLINGLDVEDEYELSYGENVFEVTASAENEEDKTVTVKINRERPTSHPGSEAEANITVYFTLLGDEKHGTGDVHTYKANQLKKWINRTAITVPAGSTVADVFDKALKAADISYTNAGGNYVSEINGLAEFDNGLLSGWMYLVNGKYSDYGVAEQSVKSGDKIVFHYTDDYTKEDGTIAPNKPSTSKPIQGTVQTDNKDNSEINKDEKNEGAGDLNVSNSGMKFGDINSNDWFFKAVEEVYTQGLMKGVSEDDFAPNEFLTRAMFITTVHRMEKEPQSSYKNVFTDVSADAYYYMPVMWAVENQIINGTSAEAFSPDDEITREQMAAILYRYAKYKEPEIKGDIEFDLSKFNDAGSVSDYASEAMQWACQKGIFNGYDDGNLYPQQLATRAETAVVLTRFIKLGVK